MKLLLGIVIYLALGVAFTVMFGWWCCNYDNYDVEEFDNDVSNFVLLWSIVIVMIAAIGLSVAFQKIFGGLIRFIIVHLPKRKVK